MTSFFTKLTYWAKLISVTGSAQLVVQLMGFVTGIIVIRLLSTQEYVFYTIANTMLGTMTILSDGGISTGVMAEGGKVWQDKEKLGAVLATGLNLRRKFAIFSLIISIPILFYFLHYHGASWIVTILILLSIIPAFYAALSDSLLEIVPKLHQDILPLQRNQISVVVGRFILSSASLFLCPWASIAIIANGLPRIYGNLQLKKIGRRFADQSQGADPHVRNEIIKIVKRVMPGAIYYCISGQLIVWILSIFGTTSSIGQIGAISRFAVIISIISTIISTLIIPRYSRSNNNKKELFKKFVLVNLFVLFICASLVSIISIFSTQLLWILGKNYLNLEKELVLNIIASCMTLFTGISFSLCSSKGWILNPYLYIFISLISIIIGVNVFQVNTLHGALLFNIYTTAIQAIIYISYTVYSISKIAQ